MRELRGKVAVVTGGASGIGRAMAARFAAEGMKVVLADVEAKALAAAREELASGGREVLAVQTDVSKLEAVEALAKKALEAFGAVHVLCNNAGIGVGGLSWELSNGEWEWVLGVNLWGVIHGCHAFVPRMKRQKSGHVVNVASAAGLLSAPRMGPYNVTKAGVVALSETLYGELRPLGLGVTVLCPTFFKTDIVKSGRGGDDSMKSVAEKLMDRSKIQAEGVAKVALDAADAGRLYAIPQADGRWMWRVKRVAPQMFHKQVARVAQRMAKKG